MSCEFEVKQLFLLQAGTTSVGEQPALHLRVNSYHHTVHLSKLISAAAERNDGAIRIQSSGGRFNQYEGYHTRTRTSTVLYMSMHRRPSAATGTHSSQAAAGPHQQAGEGVPSTPPEPRSTPREPERTASSGEARRGPLQPALLDNVSSQAMPGMEAGQGWRPVPVPYSTVLYRTVAVPGLLECPGPAWTGLEGANCDLARI